MSRITLFACIPPLTSNHLVLALAGESGMGFDDGDGGNFTKDYRKLCLELAQEEIEANTAFAQAIRGKTYGDIQRPLVKLDARGQFFALAKSIELCAVSPQAEMILEDMATGPFVLTMRNHAQLENARRTEEDNEITASKLAGFVEATLGCQAFLRFEREDHLARFKNTTNA